MASPAPSPSVRPTIHIRMASHAPLAVVTATFSGKLSRMMLWETERDVFHTGQWLKGRIEPLEVSPDGEYVAYYVHAPRRAVPVYVAVSRPPYLTALFFRPMQPSGGGLAGFTPGGWLDWAGRPWDDSWVPGHPEYGYGRIEAGCPFHVRQVDDYGRLEAEIRARYADRPAVREAVLQHGEVARKLLDDPALVKQKFPSVAQYVKVTRRWPFGPLLQTLDWDHQGRLIVVDSPRVLAYRPGDREPTELLKMARVEWQNVPTPERARQW